MTLLLAALQGLAAAVAAKPDSQPPNIVVILADDLGCRDLKLYGGWIETPRIERMASEGMKFTDFHANSSVCSPTRAAFLTGRYQQRVGIVDVIVGAKEPDQGLPATKPTLAKIFKANGYATALFGKWHCGHSDRFNPINHGFDEFIGLLNGAADFHIHDQWRNGLKVEPIEGYSTDIITDKSTDFIRRHQDQPFLLYVSHQTPHNPYQTRSDTPDKRPDGWRQNRVGDENRPRYETMLKDLDDSIGKILDTLAETGLADNTLVFFWSDNGDVKMSPVDGPYRGRKFSQFEGGHRVPAVAWWPGTVPAGSTSNALLAGFDLLPTFAQVAGIAADNPPQLDGSSFADHLLGKAPAVTDRDLFFGYEPKLGTAMRSGAWKLIVKGDDTQLYNLEVDLGETTDLATRHPDRTAKMAQAIETFKQTVVPES